jgi:transcriptional regulator with XRE-family HTH domain
MNVKPFLTPLPILAAQSGGKGLPRRRPHVAPVDEKTIGRRLRELRQLRGLTQVELAERLGLDQTLISGYERGTVRMHGALIAAFAKALRSSADEILGLQKPKRNGIVRHRGLLRRLPKIDQLSPRDLDTLLKTIDQFIKSPNLRA